MKKNIKKRIPWNKGLTKGTDGRIDYNRPSVFKKGHNKGIVAWNKGHKISAKTKEKISKNNACYWLGRTRSENTKDKIRKTIKEKKIMPPNRKGAKLSEETREKMSEARRGEKAYQWLGGISFAPYSVDWTKTLKRSIRERDKYVCQICSCQQNDNAHDVHHIDYNKENCNPKNLITLCNSCHGKTNHDREYWTNYFNNKKI